MEIDGTDAGKRQIQRALHILEKKDPERHAYVQKWIRRISAVPALSSGVDPESRHVTIGKSTLHSLHWWIAAVLVHEAQHVEVRQPGRRRPKKEKDEVDALNLMFEVGRKICPMWRVLYGTPDRLRKSKWWKTNPKDQDW